MFQLVAYCDETGGERLRVRYAAPALADPDARAAAEARWTQTFRSLFGASFELEYNAPDALMKELRPPGAIKPIITDDALANLRKCLRELLIREELTSYIVDIVRGTRQHQSVLVGAGPRATQALVLASRALAAISGRDFVTPEDIKSMAVPVLEHRLILRPEYELEGMTVGEVIGNILEDIAVPR